MNPQDHLKLHHRVVSTRRYPPSCLEDRRWKSGQRVQRKFKEEMMAVPAALRTVQQGGLHFLWPHLFLGIAVKCSRCHGRCITCGLLLRRRNPDRLSNPVQRHRAFQVPTYLVGINSIQEPNSVQRLNQLQISNHLRGLSTLQIMSTHFNVALCIPEMLHHCHHTRK